MDVYIGFDSAWTDSLQAPGAICAVGIENGEVVQYHEPRLVSFDQALKFIQEVRSQNGATLVALDQPTLVPNLTGMRPVEKVAAGLVSWLGGGVQPANRGKIGMFCDASPIWQFLTALGALENPEQARSAGTGLYLMEVFPALALASLGDGFFGRLKGPRYNPDRKTFRTVDWLAVAETAALKARSFGCEQLATWCSHVARVSQPKKAHQDKLDSALCVLIALHWRLCRRQESLLLGDFSTGYMVLPASQAVREYLTERAREKRVPMDGIIPL